MLFYGVVDNNFTLSKTLYANLISLRINKVY